MSSSDNWKEGASTVSADRSTLIAEQAPDENSKEWRLVEKLVLSLTKEQRRSRRWGIFFKILTFLYLFLLLLLFFAAFNNGENVEVMGDHTAVVEVKGVIAEGEDASAGNIIAGLKAAFEDGKSRGVILRINSPGGSPVQSGYVYDEMMRLKAKYPEKKLYAVIADIGASGAYYIAAAADKIYADKASLVGSIGVTASGFGFVETLEKLGIERRIYTSGEHKTFLDPFSPEQPEEVRFWRSVLDTTHQQFIEQVKKGRGDRLKTNTKDLFSGLVWSGEQALGIGLIDDYGSTLSVAREVIGEDKLVNYTKDKTPFERFVESLGVSIGRGLGMSVYRDNAELRLR